MPPTGPVQNTGQEFDDEDVARAYVHRPPYPPALFDRLAALAPGAEAALDLGCGPGKLAIGLARRFRQVTAIDPSAPMIRLARELAGADAAAIRWICAPAEKAELGPPFDLAVGGASLHWMDHARLFPRLCEASAPNGLVAAVEGDGPSGAPWLSDYRSLTREWVERLGFQFNHPEFVARMSAHRVWIEVEGREAFTATHRMPVADFIEGEHSRATWSRAKMGAEAARAFDDDLRGMLEPHATDGAIAFEVTTRLLWGRPRPTPRA